MLVLHVALFYSILLSFTFGLIFCFALHYFTTLYFTSCFPFLIQLLCSALYFVHAQDLSTFRSLYAFILRYFALFLPHYIPVCFALLRFFTLPRFDLLHFVLCFPYFSWFSVLTSPLLKMSFYSLFNLLRWVSRHSTSPYSALLRFAWTRGFREIRAGLTALCNLLAMQERRPPFWFYAMHFNRGFNVAAPARRLVSQINLENRLDAKSREEIEPETQIFSIALSPPFLPLIFNVFRDIFHDSFLVLFCISLSFPIWVSTFFILHVFPRYIFFKPYSFEFAVLFQYLANSSRSY